MRSESCFRFSDVKTLLHAVALTGGLTVKVRQRIRPMLKSGRELDRHSKEMEQSHGFAPNPWKWTASRTGVPIVNSVRVEKIELNGAN